MRRLRELAWQIKSRLVTVLLVGPAFPELPALEKEVKRVDLPLPDEREVGQLLDLQLGRLADNPDVRLEVDGRTREQLVQALLGLTETEIENALAKAAITLRGIGPVVGAPHPGREAQRDPPERRPDLHPPRAGRPPRRLRPPAPPAPGGGRHLHPGGPRLRGRAARRASCWWGSPARART